MCCRNWKKWTDRLLTLAFGVCVLALVWVLVQVTCFTSFRVPSPSMYPTLIPGDYILVNKWLMGARIFDIWEAVEDKEVPRILAIGGWCRNLISWV